ncbi:MAG: hypothetical protein IJT29_03245 [Oscillospiraceae bacterium]|nr:hypothetical protein [Oscillospiraceae bacterium]
MTKALREKLRSRRGIAWIFVVLLVLIFVLIILILIPSYKKYQEQGKKVACATALDTARRQLASNFMLNGFENSSAEKAKEFVAYVMNGWDDLCPDGGSVYIIPKENSPMDWDIVCGLHCDDKKLCTRLNAYNVREQLREGLRGQQSDENPYPETLSFTLHGKTGTAILVDEDPGLKRGTRTTPDYEKAGTVVYYSLVGHSDFGADSGMKDGQLWFFSFADPEHCANWSYHDEWTGDSYRGLS